MTTTARAKRESMGFLEDLRVEHRLLLESLEKLDDLADELNRPLFAEDLVFSTARKSSDILVKMIEQMRPHEEREERLLFPTIREWVPSAAPLLDTAEAEHRRIDRLLIETHGNMTSLARQSARRFASTLKELANALRGHILREEMDLYPMTETSVPAEEMERLAQEAQSREFPEFVDLGGGD